MRLLSYQSLNTDLATLLLRFIYGGVFIYAGITKIQSYDQISAMFTDIIGIGKSLSFNLLIFAELVCGFCVLIGLVTRFNVIPITFAMSIAYFIAHKNDPYALKQFPLALFALGFVLFILGSGRYSVDALFLKNRHKV